MLCCTVHRSEGKKSFRKGKEREKENDRVKEKPKEKSKSSSRREKDDGKVPKRKRAGTPTTPPPPPAKEKSSESVPVELNEAEKVREKMDGEEGAKENGQKAKTRSASPPDEPQNVEPLTEAPIIEPEVEEQVEEKEQVEVPMEEGSTAEVPDTPQSPPLPAKGETKHERLESDLSSGEDFRDSEAEPIEANKCPEVKMQQVEEEVTAENSNHEVEIPMKEKEKRRIVEGSGQLEANVQSSP